MPECPKPPAAEPWKQTKWDDKCKLPPEDEEVAFQTIKDRLRGRVNDADWDEFLRTLRGLRKR